MLNDYIPDYGLQSKTNKASSKVKKISGGGYIDDNYYTPKKYERVLKELEALQYKEVLKPLLNDKIMLLIRKMIETTDYTFDQIMSGSQKIYLCRVRHAIMNVLKEKGHDWKIITKYFACDRTAISSAEEKLRYNKFNGIINDQKLQDYYLKFKEIYEQN